MQIGLNLVIKEASRAGTNIVQESAKVFKIVSPDYLLRPGHGHDHATFLDGVILAIVTDASTDISDITPNSMEGCSECNIQIHAENINAFRVLAIKAGLDASYISWCSKNNSECRKLGEELMKNSQLRIEAEKYSRTLATKALKKDSWGGGK